MVISPNPCFILHQRSYRESSLLLDVFSRDYGRISLIAKGAKRKKSKFSGLLNLYWKLLLVWQGKSDLMTLTSAEQADNLNSLSNRTLIAGFYLNELIIRLLHKNESHSDLFRAYDKAIVALAKLEDEQKTLRVFEKHLLKSLGYGIVLDHDVRTGKTITTDHEYYYQSDHGPMLVKPNENDFIKISGQTLYDINKESFVCKKSLDEAKLLMRYILHKHLDGRPLASRNLYKSYLATVQPV